MSVMAPTTVFAMGSPENPNGIRFFGTPDCKMAFQNARATQVMLAGLSQRNNSFDIAAVRALAYDAQILAENIPSYCPNDVKTAISFADKLSNGVLKLNPSLQNKAISDIFNQTLNTVNALQGPNRMQD